MVAAAVEDAARAAKAVRVVTVAYPEGPNGPPSSYLGLGPFICGLAPTPVVLAALHHPSLLHSRL